MGKHMFVSEKTENIPSRICYLNVKRALKITWKMLLKNVNQLINE